MHYQIRQTQKYLYRTIWGMVGVVLMATGVLAQTWIPKGTIPTNAVKGGQEGNVNLYVCRSRYNGGIHPGKIVKGNCNISYGGKEIVMPSYEILVGRGTWGPARPNFSQAFIAGREPERMLYLCRATYQGLHPGKVVENSCAIGYAGEEKFISTYEVFYPDTRLDVSRKPAPPILQLPGNNATLDNGCADQSNQITWYFQWSELPQASQYHLYVIGPGARFPVIDNPNIETASYTQRNVSYVASPNIREWRWKVRVQVNGVWSDWSQERVFQVEPLNTDCRQ